MELMTSSRSFAYFTLLSFATAKFVSYLFTTYLSKSKIVNVFNVF